MCVKNNGINNQEDMALDVDPSSRSNPTGNELDQWTSVLGKIGRDIWKILNLSENIYFTGVCIKGLTVKQRQQMMIISGIHTDTLIPNVCHSTASSR